MNHEIDPASGFALCTATLGVLYVMTQIAIPLIEWAKGWF